MKKVKYLGKPANIGRFGMIEKGAVLDMFEIEWDSVLNDSDYKLLSPLPTKQEKEAASAVAPLRTEQFNLTSIPWDSSRLFNLLVARFSRSQCEVLLSAMRYVGCKIRKVSEIDNRMTLADLAVEASRLSGWNLLDKNKLNSFSALGVYTPASSAKAAQPEEVNPSEDAETTLPDSPVEPKQAIATVVRKRAPRVVAAT